MPLRLESDILLTSSRFLIIPYATSIQVYSASDSLLVRSIQVPHGQKKAHWKSRIVAVKASMLSKSSLWVACAEGSIWEVDWRTGTVDPKPVMASGEEIFDMVPLPVKLGDLSTELLVVAERSADKSKRHAITAYAPTNVHDATPVTLKVMQSPHDPIRNLTAIPEHRMVLGSSGKVCLVGMLDETIERMGKMSSTWYSFENPELVTALDWRVVAEDLLDLSEEESGQDTKPPCVHMLVGDAHGLCSIYKDLVRTLLGKKIPRCDKVRLHPRAVHAVKWSRDGNYIISGGSDRILVHKQADTNKFHYLRGLSGTIENIVVSDTGASYAIHLDDNTSIILSTATSQPTAYISGIQSLMRYDEPSKDNWVARVGAVAQVQQKKIPAILHATEPSRLFVCVGRGNQATTATASPSTPFVQIFDLEAFQNVSIQAIARSLPEEAQFDPHGYPVSEPFVTHLAFSPDGRWLATADEWTPPDNDGLSTISRNQQEVLCRGRKEMYLKFWEVAEDQKTLSLSTRINSPHTTSFPETLFDLASDPTSNRFATVGDDGMARIWRPRIRTENGLTETTGNGQTLHTWTCTRTIILSQKQAGVKTPNEGRLVFSDDGSILFVAFGSARDGHVFAIDSDSGEIRQIRKHLWSGNLAGTKALGPYLIVLSDRLVVYNVVGDKVCHETRLTDLGLGRWKEEVPSELIHLQVDHQSRLFAVAIPTPPAGSRVFVFSPGSPTPLLSHVSWHTVLSLSASPATSGFVLLDDQAQIQIISEAEDTEALALAQPLAEMGLDAPDNANAIVVNEEAEEPSDDEEEEDSKSEAESDDSDDAVAGAEVLRQHLLADIFDAAPAFALPPIADLFYRVTGLLAKKKDGVASS